ncbi:MAG: crotonyl-CoA carboxylase/reductase [Mycolicibacterium sp.]|uniref:crotonyl-CoA carboxylase/reductase n=1 Tax=Mycolicibacterium sp. TaxID=2320850 RepID=UPI003D12CF3C
MATDIYEIGQAPPLGHVPTKMWAQVIRPDRFGEPKAAFRVEQIDVPGIGPDDALVWVAAAGINYNNVWAARGLPVNVCEVHRKFGEPTDFHIGGSDASGIVYKVGDNVTNLQIGDHVVIHCGQWDVNAVPRETDPMFHPSYRIWGYESNWGSFAQFTKVQAHQCMPKPAAMSWEAAAAYGLVGCTAWRMLMGWPPHTVQKDDVVLIWGGAGGLGAIATQIVRAQGGIPITVVSSESRGEYTKTLGAKGYINRTEFDHWGRMPDWTDDKAYGKWVTGCRAFGNAIWNALGERRSPRIVFEHPGLDTIPTSVFVASTGGMVVTCAGTTGFNADGDLRYIWMRQKRLQGSHFANDNDAYSFNKLVVAGQIDPCLGDVFPFEGIGECHQLMHENQHNEGNMAALVGVAERGLIDLVV